MTMERQNAQELAAAIAEFEDKLPDWWWSIGSCSVSRDASCGPDRNGRDADLLELEPFHEPFTVDDREGTVADSLRWVMEDALKARAAARRSSTQVA